MLGGFQENRSRPWFRISGWELWGSHGTKNWFWQWKRWYSYDNLTECHQISIPLSGWGETTVTKQDWLEHITQLLDEYDSILSNTNEEHILEEQRQPLHKEFIVESAWINLPWLEDQQSLEKQQEEDIDPKNIGLQYQYHLHMKSLKASWLGMQTNKPFIPVEGLSKGNDWTYNSCTGSWSIPSMDLPEDEQLQPDMIYDDWKWRKRVSHQITIFPIQWHLIIAFKVMQGQLQP